MLVGAGTDVNFGCGFGAIVRSRGCEYGGEVGPVEVVCEIIWNYKTTLGAKFPWLPEREKEEGGKGAGPGTGKMTQKGS